MTYVISLLNRKGGSGKSTITLNLAAAFQLSGHKVLMVDSDPQGSLRDIHEEQTEPIPTIVLDTESTLSNLPSVAGDFDVALIDGAPQITKLSASAIKISDFVLIPTQPSPLDLWACADLVELIKTRQSITDGKPLAAFLISRAIKGTKLSDEIREVLQGYDLPVLNSCTRQRIAYPTSISNGTTVLERKSSPAAREIIAIRDEIAEILNREA